MNRSAPPIMAFTGIGVITLCMIFGPLASPSEFSWLLYTTSEQAGQNVPGAWIMRMGFVCYGLGILCAALLDWKNRTLVRAALVLFGAGLISTAVWSNASIVPGAVSDMHEDWLHSIASGIVGTAFAGACAARLFSPGGSIKDRLAWTGLVMSIVIPLAMISIPELRGLSQRIMFAFSFLFNGREFLKK